MYVWNTAAQGSNIKVIFHVFWKYMYFVDMIGKLVKEVSPCKKLFANEHVS